MEFKGVSDNSVVTILFMRGLSVIIYLFLKNWAVCIAKIPIQRIFKVVKIQILQTEKFFEEIDDRFDAA